MSGISGANNDNTTYIDQNFETFFERTDINEKKISWRDFIEKIQFGFKKRIFSGVNEITVDEPVYSNGLEFTTYTNIVCSELVNWEKINSKIDFYSKYYLHQIPPFFYSGSSIELTNLCLNGMKQQNIYDTNLKNLISNFSKPILNLAGSLDTQTPPNQQLIWKVF